MRCWHHHMKLRCIHSHRGCHISLTSATHACSHIPREVPDCQCKHTSNAHERPAVRDRLLLITGINLDRTTYTSHRGAHRTTEMPQVTRTSTGCQTRMDRIHVPPMSSPAAKHMTRTQTQTHTRHDTTHDTTQLTTSNGHTAARLSPYHG